MTPVGTPATARGTREAVVITNSCDRPASFTVNARKMPLEIIVPTEGVGWDLEAAGIVKGTTYMEAAQKLMDWLITDEAMMMYNEGYAVLAVPGLAKPVEHIPANLVASFIKNDFEWAASNRARILDEWTKRYDAKSEPKS